MEAWKWYLMYRYRELQPIFEYELFNEVKLAEQWLELDEVPNDIHDKIKLLCREIIPVKTKTVEIIENILEYSIISSIQVQLIVYTNFEISISSAVFTCFKKVLDGSLFKTMTEEYRVVWMAARKIQWCWRRCISTPYYLICKRRLMREFGTGI